MKQKRGLFFILAFNIVIFDETVNGKCPFPQGNVPGHISICPHLFKPRRQLRSVDLTKFTIIPDMITASSLCRE